MAKKLKIGEVCRELEIQPYVLRYWETEFPFLNPSKSKSGQRGFGAEEIKIIRRIKELLYDEGYTIAGAKKKLEAELEAGEVGDDAGSAKAGSKGGRAKARQGAKGNARELDRAGREKIKNLRSGIESALDETRAILKLLGSEAR